VSPRPERNRRTRLAVLAGVLVLLGGAALAYVLLKGRGSDISHPSAAFTPEPAARKPRPKAFAWPLYGYTKNHVRNFPAAASFGPPFRRLWTYRGPALLEFPPVIANGLIYQLADDGFVHALDPRTGRVRWQRRLGVLAASSPAAGRRSLYLTLLARAKGAPGRVVALDARRGHLQWSHDLPSRSESSPLLDGNRLYFGTEGGTVYALRARDGKTLWTYHAQGAVKGSPTLKDGVLYFGDYGGQVQAVRARDGRRVWSTASNGAVVGSGTFYATACVVNGRVVIGNTDGRVYSFVASNGKLAWARQTGNYVYGSAAYADVPGIGPTVYVGSYDGSFYALDARTGRTRWENPIGGRISGSATIVGRVVYLANLGAHQTVGLDIRTGHRVLTFPDGGFDPVIADGSTVYLTGYDNLYALQPRRHRGAGSRAPRRSRH